MFILYPHEIPGSSCLLIASVLTQFTRLSAEAFR